MTKNRDQSDVQGDDEDDESDDGLAKAWGPCGDDSRAKYKLCPLGYSCYNDFYSGPNTYECVPNGMYQPQDLKMIIKTSNSNDI